MLIARKVEILFIFQSTFNINNVESLIFLTVNARERCGSYNFAWSNKFA